ncbi:ribonuclease E inhibitor RraB [Brevundimonas sp.]
MNDDLPDDENGQILKGIQAKGVDLSVTRQLDFSLLFDDAVSAAKFMALASDQGFTCLMMEPHENDVSGCDVTACVRMLPSHHNITDAERRLAELAHPCGGELDGWGFLVEGETGGA